MSKGMQQRLGLAQALVGAPPLLLLDEPTSALDPVGRRTVRELLEELRQRGVSVLLNSHLLSEVELVCDRVAILLHGRLVAEGSPAELARARGVEIETDQGIQVVEGASREDVPRLVAELVTAGREVYGVRVLDLDARRDLPRSRGRRDVVSSIAILAGYGLREALRRKVFAIVLLLTLGFLGLYWLANHYVFRDVENISPPAGIDARAFAGAFMFGLAMFATLFLGVVLAVFLTLGVVRGDAERGLLQPLVVRPVGRSTVLFARWLGAVAVCAPYVAAVYAAAMTITGLTGHWWPDRIVVPGVELAGGVAIVAALSLLGSVFLTSTANGIAIFMIFGAGLVAGLLGSIGHALNSHTLQHSAKIAAWAIPFEALYQDGLRQITANTTGLTGYLLQLGPFGGAYTGGPLLRLWALAYLGIVGLVAAAGFARKDL